MATQLDPPQPDIDRTDELPQLDVAAYEASLASNPTIVRAQLERTQLRGSRAPAERTLARGTGPAPQAPAGGATDRDEQLRVIAELQAENVRLAELRAIGDEMVKRLEQKLRDQAVQFTAQLTELQSSRFEEHLKGEKGRDELQQQIAQKAVQLASLQEKQARLAEELRSATELAESRAATIEELRAALIDEEHDSEGLALQLASKLRGHEALKAQLAAREQMIEELRSRSEGTVADVQHQTSQYLAQIERTQQELQAIAQERGALAQRLASQEDAHNAARQSLAEQARQIAELREALQTAETNAAAAERDLAANRAVLNEEQARRHAVEEQLRAEGLNAEGLRAGLDFARTQLQELSAERDSLLSVRSEAAEKTAALERAEELLSEAQRDIATLHGELGGQAESARAREAELAAAHAAASELRRERAVMQQSLDEAWRLTEALKEEIRSSAQQLQARSAELAAAKQELGKQAPAIDDLEHALRARDELCTHLRQQLQTVQEEHGILSGQLNKVRLRVRSLADQIFQRDSQIVALKAELASHVEALAAIRRDVDRVEETPPGETRVEVQRVLVPVEHDGDCIPLDRPVISIGRTTDNDVCIPSKLISRRHARLLVSSNGVVVEDAGSTNGCYVNGIEVTQHLMQDGDVLELGELRFRLVTPSASTQARDNVIAFSGQKG